MRSIALFLSFIFLTSSLVFLGSCGSNDDSSVDPVEDPIETTSITVNGVSFDMVYVEGGTFTMGCTSEQGDDCYDRENPSHSVSVGDFRIGMFEVTQELWRAVMGTDPAGLGFLGCWVARFLLFWICGFLGVWASGLLDFWVSGCLGVWVS